MKLHYLELLLFLLLLDKSIVGVCTRIVLINDEKYLMTFFKLFSVSVSQSTLVRPVAKSVTLAGNFTGKNSHTFLASWFY